MIINSISRICGMPYGNFITNYIRIKQESVVFVQPCHTFCLFNWLELILLLAINP